MHAQQHSDAAIWLAIIASLIITALLFSILRWLDEKIRGKPHQEIPPDVVAESLKVVGTPMQLPGGRWGHYETKLVECAPPVGPSDNIHVPMDAKHRASCKRCQDEYKRGARMPHATN